MAGFRMTLGKVKIDDRGMYSVLQSQKGPVAREIRRVGLETVVIAKSLAGVRTGRLKKSIKMRRDRTVTGKYAVVVGSDVRYALVHHQGAKRHGISPKNPGGVLVFRGRRGKVVTRHVDHPGHKPNPYLVLALQKAVRR
jgi:hypothetical protein